MIYLPEVHSYRQMHTTTHHSLPQPWADIHVSEMGQDCLAVGLKAVSFVQVVSMTFVFPLFKHMNLVELLIKLIK